jgi:hypothetical protein
MRHLKGFMGFEGKQAGLLLSRLAGLKAGVNSVVAGFHDHSV